MILHKININENQSDTLIKKMQINPYLVKWQI